MTEFSPGVGKEKIYKKRTFYTYAPTYLKWSFLQNYVIIFLMIFLPYEK